MMDLATALEIGGVVFGVAKAITIFTPTPNPNTALGKVYKGIEAVALVIGKAKDTGLIPANSVADKVEKDATQLAADVLPLIVNRPPSALAIPIACAAAVFGLTMTACTDGQLDQTKVAAADTELNAVCDEAMKLAGVAGPYAPFIIGGCGSAEGLAKLASDTSSVAWVNGLIADVKKRNGAA